MRNLARGGLSVAVIAALVLTLSACSFGKGSTPYDSAMKQSGVEYDSAYDAPLTAGGGESLTINTSDLSEENVTAIFAAMQATSGVTVYVKYEPVKDVRLVFTTPLSPMDQSAVIASTRLYTAHQDSVRKFEAVFASMVSGAGFGTTSFRYRAETEETARSLISEAARDLPTQEVTVEWEDLNFMVHGQYLGGYAGEVDPCIVDAGFEFRERYVDQYYTAFVFVYGHEFTGQDSPYYSDIHVRSEGLPPSEIATLSCGITPGWR